MSDPGLWYALPVLAGDRVRLEPLAVEHTAGYLAACGTAGEAAEIFRWQSPSGGALTTPETEDDARGHIVGALAVYAFLDDDWPHLRVHAQPARSASNASRAVLISSMWP